MELAIFSIWILFVGLFGQQVQSFTYETDVTGLQAIRRGWTSNTLNWTGGDPCGDNWHGVTCRKQNVTILNLSNAGITGRLLASIGNLQNLLQLDLSFNPNLGGPLPSSLGNLMNLQFLTLQSCSFSGPIPKELGQLKNLQFLGLNMNQMSGVLPPEIGGLANCTWFDLSENNFSGDLPVSSGISGIGLDNLTFAKHFHLNNNSFTGAVPKEITILPNLIHFLVDNNNMNGIIPEEVGNFKSLEILRLDNNKFTGPFPSNISRVTTLQEIHIRNNSFTSLPDVSGLTNLLFMSVGLNRYSPQSVPASIGSLTSLQTLELDSGNFVGQFPSTLLALPAIESISLVSNNLNNTVNLGSVSPSLALISVNDNEINGLSNEPGNSFFRISLGGNPVCSNNRNLPSYVDCSTAQAAADVWSPGPGNCRLKCSKNQVLNPALCSCAIPLLIRFQFNAPTFSTMNTQRDKALRNKLSIGVSITEDQVWISKGVFITQNNRFLADVGFFPVKGVDRFSDDERTFILSQFVFHRPNMTGFDPYHAILIDSQVAGGQNGKSSGLKSSAIAGIVVGIVALGAMLAAAVFYAVKQKSRADKANETQNPFASWGGGGTDDGEAPVIKGVKGFTLLELKKATNNFSESHEIGAGGYGKVYKGYLLTGEVVAVKRAQAGSMQGAHEFKNEIELLSRLHHKNLVGLVGFCYEHGEQMLVYEYMPNGTIQDHLLGNSKILSWTKRLEIAVGSARGISYLHDLANPPIIHRDIKPTNILLDENFVAKVADLGLSKVSMADEGKTHVSTQVKGTLGYLDPEYYMTQKLTDKSDVYSFGVVLLELVTARRPIVDGQYIVRVMRNALARDDIWDLLDRSLNWHNARDLKSYLTLSMRCVDESADARPTMNDVVRHLEAILSNVASFASSGGKNDDFHVVNLYDGPLASGEFEYSGGYDVTHTIHPK